MRQFVLPVVLGLVFQAATSAAIDVPLVYTRGADWESTTCLASVQIADYDLLAPGAKPAPVYIDFQTSRSSGLRMVTDWGTTQTFGGRRGLTVGTYLFDIDNKFSHRGSRPDLYVLVEYLDSASSSSELALWYDYRSDPDSDAYHEPAEPQFTGTNQWKKFQYRLKGAYADGNATYARYRTDFRMAVAPRDRLSRYTYGSAPMTSKCPPGEWKLPTLETTSPAFSLIKLGDTERLAVFDYGTSGSKPRVHFDENGNRDLTDNPGMVREAKFTQEDGRGNIGSFEFGTQQITVTANGEKLPFYMELDGRLTSAENRAKDPQTSVVGRLQIRGVGMYRGDAVIDGQKYFLAVCDGSGNGRYDDFASSSTVVPSSYDATEWRTKSDTLHLYRYDSTGQKPDWETGIDVMLSRHVAFGRRLFRVEMSPAKSLLRLIPVEDEAKLAAIKVQPGTRSLDLLGQDTSASVACVFPADEVLVPPEAYSLHSYVMERADSEGDVWSVTGQAGPGAPKLLAAAGKSFQLKYGDPFTAELSPTLSKKSDPASADSSDVMLGLVLRGAGGEKISSVDHGDGTQTSFELDELVRSRPKAPRYRITKPDGELVTAGKLEYG